MSLAGHQVDLGRSVTLDGDRFGAMTRSIVGRLSRRSAFKAVGAAIVGAGAVGFTHSDGAAQTCPEPWICVAATGPAGPQGQAGSPGAPGVPGATGPGGVTGPTGETGVTGLPGAKGATGPDGKSGEPGSTGPTGATGATGPTGGTGESGPAGPIGATGATGPNGLTGRTGATGPNGRRGFKYVSSTITLQSGSAGLALNCGTTVVGGGYALSSPTAAVILSNKINTVANPDRWEVAIDSSSVVIGQTLTAYAICTDE
jgi:hypothetical protein